MSWRVHDLTKAITAQSRDLAFVLVKQSRVTNRTKESRLNHGQSRDLRFRRSSNHGTKHGKHAAAITAAAFSIEGGREWKRPESIHEPRCHGSIQAALTSTTDNR